VSSLALGELIRAVDALEDRAASYVTLEQVEAQVGDVAAAIEAHVLLVDYRTRVDGRQVVLCRLNRRHPKVVRLTAW
jgi:NTP pyrophosphatase (non-canonical NTP hydrolase)